MPVVETSTYRAPRLLRDGHLSTLLPSVARRVRGVAYVRERLELPDGDFIDLDWSGRSAEGVGRSQNSKTTPSALRTTPLVILTHGYLGNSTRPYMLGAAKAFNAAGYDALAWSHRGLSGELNRLPKITTHGSTEELAALVAHARARGYTRIALVGFSKGGNMTLKYAGELGPNLPPEVRVVVAISVPADMVGSVGAFRGSFYERHFLRKMQKFIVFRQPLFAPTDFRDVARLRSLDDLTTHYVAPIMGFSNHREYYEQSSSLPVLDNIRVPTLILNAQNDPVLSESCSPRALARQSDLLFVETPEHGGHCGFYEKSPNDLYWMDRRAVEFVVRSQQHPS